MLAEKLAAIERKIIVGGENLLEKAEQQAALLEQSEKQLEKQREKQALIKKQLDEKEEEKIRICRSNTPRGSTRFSFPTKSLWRKNANI